MNAKPLNARNQISRAILDQCPPIFHCHAPLKSYPSCPPAHWDASPTAVSLVAPDPGRNFQMWHLSSFPGSQRPNREWLFWPSASSTMDLGYNMMATQLIVADHEGYRIVHVKMFRPRNQFWCFGMIFWGRSPKNPVTKPRSWLHGVPEVVQWPRWHDPSQSFGWPWHRDTLGEGSKHGGFSPGCCESLETLEIGKNAHIGCWGKIYDACCFRTKMISPDQAKVVWSCILHQIRSTSMDFGMLEAGLKTSTVSHTPEFLTTSCTKYCCRRSCSCWMHLAIWQASELDWLQPDEIWDASNFHFYRFTDIHQGDPLDVKDD